jgi:hypothetical protein
VVNGHSHVVEERWERKNELLADMLRDEVGTADIAGQDGADTVGKQLILPLPSLLQPMPQRLVILG